jgi:tape measure domain-containing protein
MAKLSFAIALNLITDGFKKGTNDVKSGISSIKSTAMGVAAYFGIGFLGIKAVFDKIKDAGLATARAIAVLRANSGGIAQTGENLRFVQGVANKYKLEITGLITEYARFTAAATTAGFSVKQQQTIFEGVQKAIKGYKLSEEASGTVMGALQKMMNTGTISTRNFTNSFLKSMPQAKKALADAMGVGVDKINALVKKGIDAKGVMESFAKNLQNMSPSVDTSDLGSAKNRISNAFSGIAQDTHITTWLANITNKVADVIDYIRANARSLAYTIAGLVAGIKISQFFNQWKIFSRASSDAMVANATVAHAKVRVLESSTSRLKKQIAGLEVVDEKMSADERLAAEVQLSAKKKQLATTELALTKAKNTAKVADERAAAVQSGNAWQATWAKIKTGAASLGTSLKAIWATAGPMILITIITELIAKFSELYSRMNSIKSAFKDYQNEARKATHTREIVELETLRGMYNSTKTTAKERLELERRIGDVTGQHAKGAKNINDLLEKRISLLRTAAAVEFYTNKTLELQDRQDELRKKYGGNAPGSKTANTYFEKPKSWVDNINPFRGNDYVNDIKEYRKNAQILSDAHKKLKYFEAQASHGGSDSYTPSVASDVSVGGGKKEEDPAADELKQAEESYAQKLRELAAEKALHLTTDAAYNEALQQATDSSLVQVAASKYASVRQSDFAKELEAKSKQMAGDKSLNDLKAFTDDYDKKVAELTKQFKGGAITQDEYSQNLQNIIDESYKSLTSFADLQKGNQDYITAIFDVATKMSTMSKSLKQTLPTEEKRDTTFDYKKSDTDILGEQLDAAQKQLDALKSMALQGTDQMVNAINAQLAKVTNLSDALKLAEVKKDVKEFAKDLRSQAWSSVKNIMSGSDQIVSSWQQLGKTLNSSDARGWEKIMAIWKAMESSVDGIFSIVDAVKEWTKASEALKNAKAAEGAITIATNTAEMTSNATASEINALQTALDLDNSRRKIAANTAEAGSEVVKNNAKIPGVGIALAAAGLVAIMALLAGLPKFATGGIIGGGSTSGDKMLARVNSGEMILNGSQQKRLFSAINGGALGGQTQISLNSSKVRGSDMYLAIDNYMRATNKKWSR